jgi:putative transposase
MSSTHLSIHIHLVFSTKNRQPWLEPPIRSRVHEFLGGCLKTLNVVPEKVGGVADHVHILAGLRAKHCVADVVKEIKTASTKWIKAEFSNRWFEWQIGYGAFSVSESNLDAACRYIENQEEHHRTRTFQQEYPEFLVKHRINFDEKYLF